MASGRPTPAAVLFVVSTPTQLEGAQRVVERLPPHLEPGVLDVWARAVRAPETVEPADIAGHHPPVTPALLLGVRRAVGEWIRETPRGALVVGQDTEPQARAAIAALRGNRRARDYRVVLMPDGVVTAGKVVVNTRHPRLRAAADVFARKAGILAGGDGQMGASLAVDDAVLTWGNAWNSVFSDQGLPLDNIHPVGSPRSDALADLASSVLRGPAGAGAFGDKLLILSQPMTNPVLRDHADRWYEWLAEIAEQAERAGIECRVRLHPREKQDAGLELPRAVARAVTNSSPDVVDDLRWARSGANPLVVNWGSSLQLDAAVVGLPVVSVAVNGDARELADRFVFAADGRVPKAKIWNEAGQAIEVRDLFKLGEEARRAQAGYGATYYANVGAAARAAADALEQVIAKIPVSGAASGAHRWHGAARSLGSHRRASRGRGR